MQVPQRIRRKKMTIASFMVVIFVTSSSLVLVKSFILFPSSIPIPASSQIKCGPSDIQSGDNLKSGVCTRNRSTVGAVGAVGDIHSTTSTRSTRNTVSISSFSTTRQYMSSRNSVMLKAKNNDNDNDNEQSKAGNENGSNNKSDPKKNKNRNKPLNKKKNDKNENQNQPTNKPIKNEKSINGSNSSNKNKNGSKQQKSRNQKAPKKDVVQNQNQKSKPKSKQPSGQAATAKSTNTNQQNKKEKENKATNDNNKNKKKNKNIINLLSNPYEAGVQLRQTIDRTLKSGVVGRITKKPLTPEQKSIYYLDDRFLESKSSSSGGSRGLPSEGAIAFAERKNNFFDSTDAAADYGSLFYDDNEYIPEVLVIGATSAIGRLVVKRLLLSKKFKVRVLVNNLYSKTLNMLGTGVTYCQGELYNMESLEYALTDVDKIIFCESPPQQDELDYQMKFDQFVKDTLEEKVDGGNGEKSQEQKSQEGDKTPKKEGNKLEIQQLSELMEMKAKIAKQVDCIGMQNVLLAYQNVRHVDYGTSQAAKRSLFKFQSREEDFGLFSIHYDDDDEEEEEEKTNVQNNKYHYDQDDIANYAYGDANYDEYGNGLYDDEDDYYLDEYDTYGTKNKYPTSNKQNRKLSPMPKIAVTATTTMKTQVKWMKNKFKHGVFVGRLPRATTSKGGSEASIISSRLRSSEDTDKGIDFSKGFAGFVCRLCSDGRNYEAFIRTSEYESNGIEYVCKFQPGSKKSSQGRKNTSINQFSTVRLPFVNFVPVVRKRRKAKQNVETKTRRKYFDGDDVKQIGFRISSTDNQSENMKIQGQKKKDENWIPFYLALCYIKVFRSQPEPEFIYLSDARLGDVNGMVNRDLKQVVVGKKGDRNPQNDVGNIESTTLFDEEEAKRVITNKYDRSGEELYYKYCGEEMLKNSGLSYSIIRLPELNELNSGEFSTLQLKQSNDNLTTISRAEVAAVCESALLDPNARNVCFYLTKAKPGDKNIEIDPKLSQQFLRLKPES